MTDAQAEAQAIAQRLQDVVDGTDGWLNIDKAADIIATALAEKDAELAKLELERDKWEQHACTGDDVLARTRSKLKRKYAELNNLRASVEELSLRLCDAEGALWRVFPNTHTIPSDHPLGKKTPDPFEGPGETYRAAYERVQSELDAERAALRLAADRADRAEAGERAAHDAANTAIRQRDEALSLSSTGAVKVKALDEDDYEEIISAAAINMRKATSGIRGQVITVQDSLDWWVMKETERRILSALEPTAAEGWTHETDEDGLVHAVPPDGWLARELSALEGQQPVAYRVHAPEDEYYGVGPDRLQFHPLSQHDLDTGYRQTPLYTRPSEQAVTDEMVEAAASQLGFGPADSVRIRAALKAAMEAGR